MRYFTIPLPTTLRYVTQWNKIIYWHKTDDDLHDQISTTHKFDLQEETRQPVELHNYHNSGHYPLSCFYLKHDVSETGFYWKLLGWAQ
jgi:hypothetical protein